MNIMKAVATVGGWTLVYRISSIIRDSMQMAALGAGPFADAFAVAFKLANILRKMFAEGAFNASFLPIFSSTLKSKGQEEASKLASQILTLLTILVTLATLFCMYKIDWIIGHYANGFEPGSEKMTHAIAFGRICFPFVAASFVAALLGGVLNTVNRFAMPAAAQLALNICVVGAIYIGSLNFPSVAYTMCWGTFLAGVIQVALLWVNVHKLGFRIGFTKCKWTEDVSAFFKKLISGALGAGVWQVNIVLDISFASLLPTGSITYIYATEHLNAFPLGILGLAFSTALLPPLTKAVKAGNMSDAKAQLNLGLLFALLLTMPAVVILCTMNTPIVDTFYGYGKFGKQQVLAAAPALAAFAAGLPAYMLTKVFSSAFFAHKNTKIPFWGGIISIVVNLIGIWLFLPIYKHNGIALATSLSAWANAFFLWICLRQLDSMSISWRTWGQFILQCGASGVMLAAVLFMNDFAISHHYYASGKFQSIMTLISTIGAGVLVFMIVGKVFGIFSFMKEFKSVAKES